MNGNEPTHPLSVEQIMICYLHDYFTRRSHTRMRAVSPYLASPHGIGAEAMSGMQEQVLEQRTCVWAS